MKRFLISALLLSLSPLAGAHGGNYSGPGVSPPGAVGTGPKGPGDSVAPSGNSGAPGTPTPGAPDSRPGPAAGSQPANTPSAATVDMNQDDFTSWRYWWYYNSKPLLNLKRPLASRAIVTGSDDYFLGAGESAQTGGGVRPDHKLVHGTIVPQLIAVLESDASQQELTSAMISLARIEGDAAFEAKAEAQIAGLIGHSDLVVVEVAAISLGILGSDRSSFALVDLLVDGDAGRKLRGGQAVGDRVRAFAAYGLGQIGERTERPEVKRYGISKLQATFDRAVSTSFDVRVACLLAMGSIQLPPDPSWQPPTESTLSASICREAQVEWALRVLRNQDQHQLIRAHAPTTLARLLANAEQEGLERSKTTVVRELLGHLAPESRSPAPVTQSAALALGQLGDSDADELDVEIRATLERTLRESGDHQTRNFAMMSLAQASGRPGGDRSIVGAEQTRKALATALREGTTMQRPWAALSIGVLGRTLEDHGLPRSAELAKLLRTTLAQTRSPELTSAAALALGILRDVESESVLVEVLRKRSDTTIRGYVMIGLGLMEARGSLPQIEAILTESKYQPDLVQTAAVALALMHDTELVPKLIEILNSNASLPAQGAITFSLGNVGDVRATQALIELSTAAEIGAVARGQALSALGLVAERFDLPWNTQLSANTNYRANPSSLSNPDMVGVLDLF